MAAKKDKAAPKKKADKKTTAAKKSAAANTKSAEKATKKAAAKSKAATSKTAKAKTVKKATTKTKKKAVTTAKKTPAAKKSAAKKTSSATKTEPKAKTKAKAKTTAKAKASAPKKSAAPKKKAATKKAATEKAQTPKKTPKKKAAAKKGRGKAKPNIAERSKPLRKRPPPKKLNVTLLPRPTSNAKASADSPFKNYTPYVEKKKEQYMNPDMEVHFRTILNNWRTELMEEVDGTINHMQDEAANFPDPADRATQEEEFSIELRTRDRERKLIKKIDQTLERLEQEDYGFCDTCGIEIGLRRLEARPTATQCVDCKTLDELRERQLHG